MPMNTRIRELRKTLNLTQKEFAQKIGLKQNAISYMEKADSTVTEQNIRTICSQFSVNENWLRRALSSPSGLSDQDCQGTAGHPGEAAELRQVKSANKSRRHGRTRNVL